jgi:hypothetical protein
MERLLIVTAQILFVDSFYFWVFLRQLDNDSGNLVQTSWLLQSYDFIADSLQVDVQMNL